MHNHTIEQWQHSHDFNAVSRHGEKRTRLVLYLTTLTMVAEIAAAKDGVLPRLMELYDQFRRNAEAAGVKVHFARDADEANAIIAGIAQETGSKKSSSRSR